MKDLPSIPAGRAATIRRRTSGRRSGVPTPVDPRRGPARRPPRGDGGGDERRDSAARAALQSNLTDAGSTDDDAGRKWLESNAPVNTAINQAGISVKDYFVAGIAIAAAERFTADPKAAPPTPSLAKNAEFLRSHAADLQRLHTQEALRPVVVSKP